MHRPVSAYALFFRDTQAAIKGGNPSASFGEVSKIVASMWDSLDPDTKNVSNLHVRQIYKQSNGKGIFKPIMVKRFYHKNITKGAKLQKSLRPQESDFKFWKVYI